jgi:hypothetical protein
MLLQSINQKSFAFAALAVLTAVSLPSSSALAEGPFARFAGHWRGTGKISMSDGTKESITCRGSYAVADAGATLMQSLTCASASYKVEVSSQVQAQGDKLSGSWSETSRGVSGSVSGSVAGGIILATVTGATFSAGLSLKVTGGAQYVDIKPSGTTDITEVTVTMKRS